MKRSAQPPATRKKAAITARRSLVELLKAAPSLKHRTWFDRMAEGPAKQELREVKAAYRAGEFGNRGYKWLHDSLREHMNLPCGIEAFGAWLKRGDS